MIQANGTLLVHRVQMAQPVRLLVFPSYHALPSLHWIPSMWYLGYITLGIVAPIDVEKQLENACLS